MHQFLLSVTQLQNWTLHSPRTNLINHNKEGLVSLPGYLAIHLLGLSVGLLIFPPTPAHFQRTGSVKVNNSDSSSEDEAYARDAWIDDSKSGSSETKKRPEERDDSKTAIELCSYGVLYALLFLFVRLAAPGDNVSRVMVRLLLFIIHSV